MLWLSPVWPWPAMSFLHLGQKEPKSDMVETVNPWKNDSLLPYWKDNPGCPCRWVSDDIWRYGRTRMWWYGASVRLTHSSSAIFSVHNINESGYITDLLSEIVEVCMFTRWVNIKTKTICKSVLIWNRSGNFELGFNQYCLHQARTLQSSLSLEGLAGFVLDHLVIKLSALSSFV